MGESSDERKKRPEMDRLDSHFKELNDVLSRDEAVGRRLDFLMQELNREANTLGSKSVNAETTRASRVGERIGSATAVCSERRAFGRKQ